MGWGQGWKCNQHGTNIAYHHQNHQWHVWGWGVTFNLDGSGGGKDNSEIGWHLGGFTGETGDGPCASTWNKNPSPNMFFIRTPKTKAAIEGGSAVSANGNNDYSEGPIRKCCWQYHTGDSFTVREVKTSIFTLYGTYYSKCEHYNLFNDNAVANSNVSEKKKL